MNQGWTTKVHLLDVEQRKDIASEQELMGLSQHSEKEATLFF